MQEKSLCAAHHSVKLIRNEFNGLEPAIFIYLPKDGPAPFIDPDKPDDDFVSVPHFFFLPCLKKEKAYRHRQPSSTEYVG